MARPCRTQPTAATASSGRRPAPGAGPDGEPPAPGLASRPQPPAAGAPAELPRLPRSGRSRWTCGRTCRGYGAPPYFGQPGRLIPVLKAAGLTGRGGAAFPVHRKLAAVAEAATQPVVIGNGAEGEPASDKDKSLLWISPHLVLDGLQLAAEAVGSDRGWACTCTATRGCRSGCAPRSRSGPRPGSTPAAGRDHRRAAALPGR